MPELPDLEAIKDFLQPRLVGAGIERLEVLQATVIRQPAISEFTSILSGDTFEHIDRRGKFLLFTFKSGHTLGIHLMLAGRLQYCEPKEPRRARTCLVFHLSGGRQLRYFDPKLMGKVYLVGKGKLSAIPRWNEMGPDALDDGLTLEVFRRRIKKYSGQVKNVLTKDTFVTGIGNAYADEILFEAGIYPFWPRASLSDVEIERLYNAMRAVLRNAITIVAERMGDDISVEIRDFLKIHRRGGKPCPRCGAEISQIEANRRITSFCRTCQGEHQADMFSSLT